MNKIIFLLAAAALIVAAVFWRGFKYDDLSLDGRRVDQSSRSRIPLNVPSVASAAYVENAPAAMPKIETYEAAGRRIYSQKDLYPFLVRMQSERALGSWASGHQVLSLCMQAQVYLVSSGVSTYAVAGMEAEARQDAKHKLLARCVEQPLGIYSDQYAVRSDDVAGRKYQDAKLFLNGGEWVKNPERMLDAMNELARQHKLEEGANVVKLLKQWDGERWKGDPQEFSLAVDAAVELATAEHGNEKDDLRLITRCFIDGRCDYQYGSVAQTATPEQREKLERIAREMAHAIRSGDVKRFLGASPRIR